MKMNMEHKILDNNGKEFPYLIPDTVPLFNDDDTINNTGLLHFLKATRALKALPDRYDYFIRSILDVRYNQFGDIYIDMVNIDNPQDNKRIITIRLLD